MLPIGSEIKGYRIERLLGQGGMGEVYEATQLTLGRTVAFKVLQTRLGQDEGFRERFRREGRLQATLEHPNVVTVYEAGEIENGLFLAMRMVRGATLKQLIVQAELDAARTLRLLAPVAEALDAAHALGLVHRDVKPQNILVGDDDHPYLADFGLTLGGSDTALTGTGQFLGTIDYVSPEQLRGEPAGASSDLYALAGVLYECLAGTVPFARPTEASVLYAHAHEAPPSLVAHRRDLPEGIDEVIARGMAKEPEDRPVTAVALLAEAERVLGSDPTVASSRPQPMSGTIAAGVRPVRGETDDAATPAIAESPPSERSRPMLTVAAAGLVAVSAAAFFFGSSGNSGEPGDQLSVSASSGALALSAPANWQRTGSGESPEVPGLALRDTVALTAPEPAAGVVAGLSNATGRRLLPKPFVDRLGDDVSEPERVRLGELQALRYERLRVRGFDRELSVYAVPTSTGVATVACYAPNAAFPSFRAGCERVAQTLELVRGRSFPLDPPTRTRRAIDSAVTELAKARRAARSRLARASKPDSQADQAAALARAYERAATRVGAVEGGPALQQARDGLARQLEAVGAGYRRLAAAAREGDGGHYARARRQVQRAEGLVRDRIASLERALGET